MKKCTEYIKEGLLFEYRKKYTLHEITEILGSEIRKATGAKILIIGNKIVVKGEGELNAEIYFDSTEASTYCLIRIKIINTKSQVTNNQLKIDMRDKKYGVGRADLKGGYFWTYDNTWYGHVPDFNIIIKEIKETLEFLDVI